MSYHHTIDKERQGRVSPTNKRESNRQGRMKMSAHVAIRPLGSSLFRLTLLLFVLVIVSPSSVDAWTLDGTIHRSATWRLSVGKTSKPCLGHTTLCSYTDGNDSNNNDDDVEDDGLYFDDFDGQLIGGDKQQQKVDNVLQERIASLQQSEQTQQSIVLDNWKSGNWQVRGFRLDPEPQQPPTMKEATSPQQDLDGPPIHVSCIATSATSKDDDDEDDLSSIVWVGRTDGSFVGVLLGTEYLTRFQSQISAQAKDNDGNQPDKNDENSNLYVEFSSRLVNDQQQANPHYPSMEKPFQLVYQGRMDQASVERLYVTPTTQSDVQHLFTADANGLIQQWIVSLFTDDDAEDGLAVKLVKAVTLQDPQQPPSSSTTTVVHHARLVALQGLSLGSSGRDNVLFTAALDGTMALWDLSSGDLLVSCQLQASQLNAVNANDPIEITCADTINGTACLGTSTGQVVCFDLQCWMESASAGNVQSCPLPNGQWVAGSNGGAAITAIASAGPGSLAGSSNHPSSSFLLLTGDETGVVKQWEVLSRPVADAKDGGPSGVRLEQWPKMATQRLPKKAHVFTGHEGPVTALRAMDGGKFLSSSFDGTLVAWDSTTGKSMYRMDGFTNDISSLCIQGDALVTNGMEEYVCVHDFDIGPEDEDTEDGFDLDFD